MKWFKVDYNANTRHTAKYWDERYLISIEWKASKIIHFKPECELQYLNNKRASEWGRRRRKIIILLMQRVDWWWGLYLITSFFWRISKISSLNCPHNKSSHCTHHQFSYSSQKKVVKLCIQSCHLSLSFVYNTRTKRRWKLLSWAVNWLNNKLMNSPKRCSNNNKALQAVTKNTLSSLLRCCYRELSRERALIVQNIALEIWWNFLKICK